MKRWIEPEAIDVPSELIDQIDGHPLVTETLVRRGITDIDSAKAFLNPSFYTPASPYELPNMDKAVKRLLNAIEQKETICVWGDFDVDGQTSTTLLVDTLRELGATVTYHIPIRETESHGITIEALKKVLDQNIDVLLTCDTGITEHEPIAYAQIQGVDVIVTDHHTLPDQLPEALALVNPQMLDSKHPLFTLPGVGVAYKLAEALYEQKGKAKEVERHLDLVALGIVADIAAQRGDTRFLLQKGLEVLRQTDRLGLKTIFKNADLNTNWISEEHIGFAIGPRLNALGRLSDANAAVELLTTHDSEKADLIATQLEGLNSRRKLMCDQVFQAAMTQLDHDPSLLDHPILVLSQPAWPAGVIGIVASRLVDHFHLPTILIANPPEQAARGSARSIEGCNITEIIATQSHLLQGFGGHPMAAGLKMDSENISAFRMGASKAMKNLEARPLEARLCIDGYLPLEDISLDLIEDLERLAPFGAGNPPLNLVTRNLNLVNPRTIGRHQEHRQMIVKNEADAAQKVMWWRGSEWDLPQGRFDLAYRLRASNFLGKREAQVEWVDARLIPGSEDSDQFFSNMDVLDYRLEENPASVLRQLQDQKDIQVWAETDTNLDILGRSRYELSAAPTLVVWNIPPSGSVLEEVLASVVPEKVVLFGVNPNMDSMKTLLSRLAGLLKFALSHRHGEVRVSRLAGATAQTESTVRMGITWLAAKGMFQIHHDGDTLHIAPGSEHVRDDLQQIAKQLQVLLQETTAYRKYYLGAEKHRLIEFSSPDMD